MTHGKISKTYVDAVIKVSVLSYGNDDGLMVRSGVDRAETVRANRDTRGVGWV